MYICACKDTLKIIHHPLSLYLCIIIITDKEAPHLNCIRDQSAQTDTGVVKWGGPLASDNSRNVSVTCDPELETNVAIAQTKVTCEAVDVSGNRAVCYLNASETGKYCASSCFNGML